MLRFAAIGVVAVISAGVSAKAVMTLGQGGQMAPAQSVAVEPAPGAEVETAHKAVVGLYRTGLDSLAKGFSTN